MVGFTRIYQERIYRMDKSKLLKIQRSLYAICFVLVIIALIRGYWIAGKQIVTIPENTSSDHDTTTLQALNDQWTLYHEDGSSEAITLPYEVKSKDSEVTISREIQGLFTKDSIIKFDNQRQGVVVLVDQDVIYEVNTTHLTNQLVFTDYQILHLPDKDNMTTLSLHFIFKTNDHYSLPSISYGSYYAASSEIIRNDISTLIILVILLLVLLADFIIYLYCLLHNMPYSRIMYLAVFVLTAILWGYTDSYLPSLLHIPQEILGLVCYLSIMALPLPMCNFVGKCCKNRNHIFQVLSILGTLNLIGQIILSSLGLIQLQVTFYAAHIFILITIVASLICIYEERKHQQSREMDILNIGILGLALVSLISLFFYWQKGLVYYRTCMLTGILLFSVSLFLYVIIYYIGLAQKNQLRASEVKIHERLSMFDELTGLPNRRAFEKKMDEIEAIADQLEDAIFIMLDVNGLKMVNDQYGHAAGDDLIAAAAKVISQTYGQDCSCFRIGGDEFAVIMEQIITPISTYDRIFNENIDKINDASSRWKLSIAKGISHLYHVSGQQLTISDWKQEADVNMYRNKVSMTGGENRDRAKDLKDIINCIISTVEAKDVYTAAHSERVRELSYCIAHKLGASSSTLRTIETSANLHDIGKIGIPDYVLLKPGKLSDDEYQIMKRHSTIGAGIISQAKGMQEIANIVLHHHERWDGKGYPDGLSMDAIPFESRVIAVADSIDAMTSRRVYHDCMTLDECYKELEKNAGIMYDPAITQIVLQNWKDIVDIVLLHPKRLINEEQ